LAAQDILVERLRLGFGLGVQFALQDSDAHLVLAQGGASPPELGIEAHERSVYGLLEGVEGQQPEGRLHRRLE
jgi:hypothetical protein